MLLLAVLVAGCADEVLAGALLFELHAMNDAKKATNKNVLENRESVEVEVGIGFFYSQQVRAVNRTDVLKYVRAAVRIISSAQT